MLGTQDIPIRARVDGFLETIHFIEGQDVAEGQLLYTIDPRPFQQKLVEAESALAAAETTHAKALSDLRRIRPLAEMNAVSQQDLDAAVAQEAATLAGVKSAEAGVELANIELGYTYISYKWYIRYHTFDLNYKFSCWRYNYSFWKLW